MKNKLTKVQKELLRDLYDRCNNHIEIECCSCEYRTAMALLRRGYLDAVSDRKSGCFMTSKKKNFYWRPQFKYYPTVKLLEEWWTNLQFLKYYFGGAEDLSHHKVAAIVSIQKILVKRLGSIEAVETAFGCELLRRM